MSNDLTWLSSLDEVSHPALVPSQELWVSAFTPLGSLSVLVQTQLAEVSNLGQWIGGSEGVLSPYYTALQAIQLPYCLSFLESCHASVQKFQYFAPNQSKSQSLFSAKGHHAPFLLIASLGGPLTSPLLVEGPGHLHSEPCAALSHCSSPRHLHSCSLTLFGSLLQCHHLRGAFLGRPSRIAGSPALGRMVSSRPAWATWWDHLKKPKNKIKLAL
jgi:hypothetical protein